MTRRGALVASATLLILSVSGCGYRLGYQFVGGARTICVPTFLNRTFPLRREIEFDVTRAVRQQLEVQTDVRVVSCAEADARLEGTVVELLQGALAEGPQDSVEIAGIRLRIRIRIVDQRTGEKLYEREVRDQENFSVIDGETFEQARLEAIGEIAERLVSLLEVW